jgi:hypothetical protein
MGNGVSSPKSKELWSCSQKQSRKNRFILIQKLMKKLSADEVIKIIKAEIPISILNKNNWKTADESGDIKFQQLTDSIIKPQLSDVATGMIAYRDDKNSLQAWASFLLTTNSIDLENFETETGGDILLNALWDANYGEPIPKNAFARAEELALGDL